MKRAISITALLFIGLLSLAVPGNAAELPRESATQTVAPVGSVTPDGWLCNSGIHCGHIYNNDNRYNLRITDNWAAFGNSGTWHTLVPGQGSANIGVVDADGLFVPPGCEATVAFVQHLGPGWYKVTDQQEIHVTDLTGTCQVW